MEEQLFTGQRTRAIRSILGEMRTREDEAYVELEQTWFIQKGEGRGWERNEDG